MPKDGNQHRESLRDGREVYLDGVRVGDVTVHPAYRNAVSSACALYDFQCRPENLDLMTFESPTSGERVNRAWQLTRTYEELVQRRKAIVAWMRLSRWLAGTVPRPHRVLDGGAGDGHPPVPAAQRGARAGAARLLRLGPGQRHLHDLRHHQPAGRPVEGHRRAGGRVPDLRRGRRGFGRNHGARREDARHRLDHGERGAVRQHPAAQAGRGEIRHLLRRADGAEGRQGDVQALLRGLGDDRVRLSAVDPFRRERRADLFRRREGPVGAGLRLSRHRHGAGAVLRHLRALHAELPGGRPA